MAGVPELILKEGAQTILDIAFLATGQACFHFPTLGPLCCNAGIRSRNIAIHREPFFDLFEIAVGPAFRPPVGSAAARFKTSVETPGWR
ncbi:hypothetical protein [Bradyrhizobium ivorense]|uniref:hypothetical protein n=1 Tax=Bradyrhizobium ivorense TaxID=2511166 RepID=UPI001117393D|nr:hypothetical protein [Bradyrhizobium ivorense]